MEGYPRVQRLVAEMVKSLKEDEDGGATVTELATRLKAHRGEVYTVIQRHPDKFKNTNGWVSLVAKQGED